jgi:putative restriction endonuclease
MGTLPVNKDDGIRRKIAGIVTWSSGSRRAPHKPLQLLIAIANIQHDGTRLIRFADVEPKLHGALSTFGPVRKSKHPEYPFWHLQSDGIWEIKSDEPVQLRRGSLNPTAKQLRVTNAKAGFTLPVHEALEQSPDLQIDVIHDILDSHFPASIHEDIIRYFGLSVRCAPKRIAGLTGEFYHSVLSAYGGVCAISNFAVRINGDVIGVEPAHIVWPQAGGKDVIPNGIAMTTLHRKLFHMGVFAIDANYRVQLSPIARGPSGFMETLGQFAGKKISLPADQSQFPLQDALLWHRTQVFRG